MLIFQSKIPWTFYLLVGFLISTSILFTTFAIIGRLDIDASIFCVVLFNVIAFLLFGRYLCKLRVYDNKILITYIYPIKFTKTFTFNKVSEIDARGDTVGSSWGLLIPGVPAMLHRGFYRLYLTDESGALKDIKYNINESDNKKFIEILNSHRVTKKPGS